MHLVTIVYRIHVLFPYACFNHYRWTGALEDNDCIEVLPYTNMTKTREPDVGLAGQMTLQLYKT